MPQRITCGLILSLVAALSLFAVRRAHAESASPCEAFHISFDDESFLKDDYSAAFGDLPFEKRGMKFVPGVFGRALLNDNVFVESDFQKTHMSVRDLDVLLQVICHHRFRYFDKGLRVGGMHPYFWGTGRLKTDGGTLAFWAKGRRGYPGDLFFLGSSSFGRLEKYLLGIVLHEDHALEAYVVDARYERHSIRSQGVWKDDQFNHVALVWDRSQGLTLYLNGQSVASNWGSDAWWMTQTPGLFHMPMCGWTCDELWIVDCPLDGPAVEHLMRTNQLPAVSERGAALRAADADRLRRAFIGKDATGLPTVGSDAGKTVTRFLEVYPDRVGDGCVGAPALIDGRYEMAWPMGYTAFTNILGDSDYQPEKADVFLPRGSVVNYISIEGNLSGASVLAGRSEAADRLVRVLEAPSDGRFFCGRQVEPVRCDQFRLPFVKGYGSPPGYDKGLHLPLTGSTRIHEVAFYHVKAEPLDVPGRTVQKLRLAGPVPVPRDGRYGYAMRAACSHRDRAVLSLTAEEAGSSPPSTAFALPVRAFQRLNLLSEPLRAAQAVTSTDVMLRLEHLRGDEVAILRLHDPGVPARIWNTVVLQLSRASSGNGWLGVRLDCVDIRMAAGDRLWLDLTLTGDAEVAVGGREPSCVRVEWTPLNEAEPRYASKALQPSLSSLTKIYPWYYPWVWTPQADVTEHPVTFGGYYDIINYPSIVLRTQPDSTLARVVHALSLLGRDVRAGYTVESWEYSPKHWPPIRLSKADDCPDWAFHMDYYLTRFQEIVQWWSDRQNSDGQVGGGWNDDVLFASRLPGPLLYLGDLKARTIFDRVFEGLDKTRMFEGGYCNISPIDSIHAEDLVRHRYEGLIFDLGNPAKLKQAMSTAWHLGKPDQTPANYGDGNSFRYDRDAILWYWGRGGAKTAYRTDEQTVTACARRFSPAMNDVIRFRYTEAGMYADASTMPGSLELKPLFVGGDVGPFLDRISLAVSWEDGLTRICRWVESASDTTLIAHLYSFEALDRDVVPRLLRLKRGVYDISLTCDGVSGQRQTLLHRRVPLRRFTRLPVPIPPHRTVTLRMDLVQAIPGGESLPDLAVDQVRREGTRVTAEVLNFGPVATGSTLVRLEDAAGRSVAQQVIPGLKSAEDFVPGQCKVELRLQDQTVPLGRVVVDPDDAIEEICEENNGQGL